MENPGLCQKKSKIVCIWNILILTKWKFFGNKVEIKRSKLYMSDNTIFSFSIVLFIQTYKQCNSRTQKSPAFPKNINSIFILELIVF